MVHHTQPRHRHRPSTTYTETTEGQIVCPLVYMKGGTLVQKPPALPLMSLGDSVHSYLNRRNGKDMSRSSTKAISFTQLATSMLFIALPGNSTTPILEDLPLPYASQCSFDIDGCQAGGSAYLLCTDESIRDAEVGLEKGKYEGHDVQADGTVCTKLVSRPVDINGWTTLNTNMTTPDWPGVPVAKCYVIACKIGYDLSRVDGRPLMGAFGVFSVEVPLLCAYGGHKLNETDKKFFSQMTVRSTVQMQAEHLHRTNAPYLVKRCETGEYVVSHSTKQQPYKTNTCVTLTESQKEVLDTHIQRMAAVYIDAISKGGSIPHTVALESAPDTRRTSPTDAARPYPDFVVVVRKGRTQETPTGTLSVTDNIKRRRAELASIDLYRFVPGSFRERRPPSVKPVSFWFYEECSGGDALL